MVLFMFHKINKVGESWKLVLFPNYQVQKVADYGILPNISVPAGAEYWKLPISLFKLVQKVAEYGKLLTALF
jgi:hypothetical protein